MNIIREIPECKRCRILWKEIFPQFIVIPVAAPVSKWREKRNVSFFFFFNWECIFATTNIQGTLRNASWRDALIGVVVDYLINHTCRYGRAEKGPKAPRGQRKEKEIPEHTGIKRPERWERLRGQNKPCKVRKLQVGHVHKQSSTVKETDWAKET